MKLYFINLGHNVRARENAFYFEQCAINQVDPDQDNSADQTSLTLPEGQVDSEEEEKRSELELGEVH